MKLISIKEYAAAERISERTAYRRAADGKVRTVETDAGTMVIQGTRMDEEAADGIIERKKGYWNSEIKRGNVIYKRNMRANKDTAEIIEEILSDLEATEKLIGKKIKGYDRRSLQMKIKTGILWLYIRKWLYIRRRLSYQYQKHKE